MLWKDTGDKGKVKDSSPCYQKVVKPNREQNINQKGSTESNWSTELETLTEIWLMKIKIKKLE
jgi:hypothetical protein